MKKINNIKLKYKLALIYLITGILPIIVLFSFSYLQMKKILIDRDTKNVQSFLNQSVMSVDGQIEVYNNLSNYISFNETISRIVSYDYKSEYEMYSQFAQTFDPMVSSLKYFHADVNQVTIYTDNEIKHDTTIAPLSEIESEKWYLAASENTAIQWFADSEKRTLISARKMPALYNAKMLGIMYINVDYDKVFLPYQENTLDNYGIVIFDEYGNMVYKYDRFTKGYEKVVLDQQEFKDLCEKGTWNSDILEKVKDYSVIRKKSSVTGWTSYMYEPESLVIHSAKPIVLMILVAAAVAIVGSVTAIIFTSKFITNRIKKLEENMHEVKNGNLKVQVVSSDKDEIGELIHGFGSMLNQINNLITEVYQGKINQKEYEMRALRAQINPHFLYNSLSLINWKAIEYEQEDISEITLALSNYYRTSLNKGKNTLSVEMELMNMKSYLDIQQIMHDYNFDVIIDVDKEIYGYESLNLILQPLIENAIDHGIDLKTDGRGEIRIIGRLQDNKDNSDNMNYVCLIVQDNGVGMSKESVDNFLTVQSKGYGTKNVNERIKLYYGEQYNLKVESEIGIGTKITIRFPAIKYEG